MIFGKSGGKGAGMATRSENPLSNRREAIESSCRRLDFRERLLLQPDLPADALAEYACDDQVARWHAGERIPAEAYLSAAPRLVADDEAAFALIYNEFALRESGGDAATSEEFAWRFPRFADRLRRQVALHQALEMPNEPAVLQGSEVAPEAEPIGPRIPGYAILGELGRGGMGVVYKARHIALNRLVALKVIHAGGESPAAALARFRGEAEAVARFQHPNIIQLHEIGECDGLAYLTLEYAAGGSLHEILAGTPQNPASAATTVETLARAIHHAHESGVIHRDLKPANIVLTDEGVPKITDFGLAKLMESSDAATLSGAILGTPSYMAPEQLLGPSVAITSAVDVYALGAIFYEMLAGRPPFKGSTPMSTLEQVATQEPLSPGKLQRQIPRDLETICLKCLEKDPRRRYASALDLAEDLRRFREGRPILARPAMFWELAWKWARRHPTSATAAALFVVALALLIGGGLHYQGQLREALKSAEVAETSANRNARAMLEQRNLALKAFYQLIYEFQDKWGDVPATRSLRRSLLDTAITGLDEIARNTEGAAPNLARAVAHQRLGDIYHHVGRSEDARRQFDQAIALASYLLASSPNDLNARECLARATVGLGELDRKAKRYGEAVRRFRDAVDAFEAIASANPDRPGARRGLFEAYLRLGRAHGFAKEYPEAARWLSAARERADMWVVEEPENPEPVALLSWSYRKLADIHKLSGNTDSARRDYLKAIAIGRGSLVQHPDHLESMDHMAIAMHDLAGVYVKTGELDDAEGLFTSAETIFTRLVEADPEDLDTRFRLVHAQYDLAKLVQRLGRFSEAADCFERALSHLVTLKTSGRLAENAPHDFQRIDVIRREIASCRQAH